MHQCDFCGIEIVETDGALIPGPAMNAALDQGYAPTMCPNWSVIDQRVRDVLEQERQTASGPTSPTSDQAVFQRVNLMLRTPQMNWRLCNVCCSTLGPYLPPRVPAGPGFSSSGNESDLDPSLKYVLPFNTSGWAIAAGYAGLFAVLVFPAPIALILGIVALYDISNKRKRGQKINGKGRAIFATIMGGLFTLVL